MLGEYTYYNAEEVKRMPFKFPREIIRLPGGIHWIHIPVDPLLNHLEDAKEIQRAFNIDRLTWEDITKGDHLPKVEIDDNRIFIVMQVLRYEENTQHIIKDQLSILIKDKCLYTFQHGTHPVVEQVQDKLKINRNNMRGRDMDYLLYSLMGSVLNQHFLIFDQFQHRMDDIEALVMRQSKGNYIHDLYRVRKEIMKIKSAVSPMKDIIRTLVYESDFIKPEHQPVYLDLNDRLLEINETLAYYRELVTALYDMHQSNASNRMNRIMTTLTVYSAIFIPLTFLAGVYGMNFKYLPELEWKWSYPAFWVICIVLTLSMVSYFKRKKWL